jgi:hypothetical protein
VWHNATHVKNHYNHYKNPYHESLTSTAEPCHVATTKPASARVLILALVRARGLALGLLRFGFHQRFKGFLKRSDSPVQRGGRVVQFLPGFRVPQ